MRNTKPHRPAQPYFFAMAIIAALAATAYFIYSADASPQWLTFMAGLLAGAMLAWILRFAWLLMQHKAQLAATKDQISPMPHLYKQGEKNTTEASSRLRLMDESMSTMIALIDREGVCRYHNQAFRNWLHLRPEQIQDRPLREILGSKIYHDLEAAIRQSLDGQIARYERMYTMSSGAAYRLAMEHIPQLGKAGKVTGFYMLANDLTGRGDVAASLSSAHETAGNTAGQSAQTDQDLFIDSLTEQVAGQEEASRHILLAIENSEFSLYCQLITPLESEAEQPRHYEILVRLNEEEQNMMPPGAFFPLAEKYGLMPYLDRWVIQHVLQQVATLKLNEEGRQDSVYFINVARDTIRDPEFTAFLAAALQEHEVEGRVLCFEVPNTELALASATVAEFVNQVSACGCHVALSGFGRHEVSFNLIHGFQVGFLKIDGSIIFEVVRDPVYLAKVAAIIRVARKMGVKTIAEMVENEETVAKLREIGVDFAQGFGISR
ncbi:MAG: EAL domain-containing protein, partial [Gallionellaceae bacterium]|nr:EAL domain-containing protein [Gallionellaceae bacterium]